MEKRRNQFILSLLSKSWSSTLSKCYWFLMVECTGRRYESHCLGLLHWELTKANWLGNFPIKVTGELFDYYDIVPKEK